MDAYNNSKQKLSSMCEAPDQSAIQHKNWILRGFIITRNFTVENIRTCITKTDNCPRPLIRLNHLAYTYEFI